MFNDISSEVIFVIAGSQLQVLVRRTSFIWTKDVQTHWVQVLIPTKKKPHLTTESQNQLIKQLELLLVDKNEILHPISDLELLDPTRMEYPHEQLFFFSFGLKDLLTCILTIHCKRT